MDADRPGSLGVATTKMLEPNLVVYERRLSTFLTYPSGDQKRWENLADAGYFYKGKIISVLTIDS